MGDPHAGLVIVSHEARCDAPKCDGWHALSGVTERHADFSPAMPFLEALRALLDDARAAVRGLRARVEVLRGRAEELERELGASRASEATLQEAYRRELQENGRLRESLAKSHHDSANRAPRRAFVAGYAKCWEMLREALIKASRHPGTGPLCEHPRDFTEAEVDREIEDYWDIPF